MTFPRFSMAACAVLGVAAASLVTAAPANAACGYYKEAYASGVFQFTTEFAARSRWRDVVRANYGYSFAHWGLARDKTMRCRKLDPSGRWHCVARAQPCNA